MVVSSFEADVTKEIERKSILWFKGWINARKPYSEHLISFNLPVQIPKGDRLTINVPGLCFGDPLDAGMQHGHLGPCAY